jgi:hypothetical protein
MDKAVTWVRLDPAVKQALADLAKADQRSLSTYINIIVRDWVRRAGLLDKPAKESRR